jgi:hypothetical protein
MAAVSAAQLVGLVMSVLHDRRGFDHWWDDLDPRVQEEIIEEMTDVVEDEL